VVLEDLWPNSAALKAGLKAHDVLLELAGKPVPAKVADAIAMIASLPADKPVDAVVLRRGRRLTVNGVSLAPSSATPTDAAMPEIIPGRNHAGARVAGLPGAPVPGGIDPRFPIVPGRPRNIAPGPAAGGGDVVTTLRRSGDRFTVRHQEGSLLITVTGTTAGGRSAVSQIAIQDGGAANSYGSVDQLPEAYRERVKGLVDWVARRNAGLEVKAP
jgi:hypothetical protein